MSANCQACSAPTDLFLCPRCTTELRETLEHLPQWVEHLVDVALRQTRLGSGNQRRTKGDEFPALFAPDTETAKGETRPSKQQQASQLVDQVHGTLVRWCQDIAETRGVSWWPIRSVGSGFVGPLLAGWRRLPTGYMGTRADMTEWLAHYVTAIACDESAGLCFREIHEAVRLIDRVINRPDPPKLWGRCLHRFDDGKDCATAIYGRRDAVEVSCPNRKCRTTYNAEALFTRNINASEYMHFTREELIGNQRTQIDDLYWLGIMGEIGEAVHYKQFQRWLKDGKLSPKRYRRPNGRCVFNRHSDADVPEYLLADVRRVRRSVGRKEVAAS